MLINKLMKSNSTITGIVPAFRTALLLFVMNDVDCLHSIHLQYSIKINWSYQFTLEYYHMDLTLASAISKGDIGDRNIWDLDSIKLYILCIQLTSGMHIACDIPIIQAYQAVKCRRQDCYFHC